MRELKERVLPPHYRSSLLLCSLMLFSSVVWARSSDTPASDKPNVTANVPPATIYQVEVLIFQRLDNLNLGNQSTDANLIPLRLANAVELDDPLALTRSNNTLLPTYYSLPSSLFKLKSIEQKLNAAPGYRVLLHDAWYQAQNSDASPVHLYASPLPHDKLSGAFNTNPVVSPYFTDVPFEINGTVTIKQRGNYTAELNVVYSQDNNILAGLYPQLYTQLTQAEDRIAQFGLRANRKMRNGEIHYFESPLFGVLMTVNEARH